MKIRALASLVMALTLSVAHADEPAPREVLTKFFTSLKEGKTADAVELVFTRPGKEQATEGRIVKLAEKAKYSPVLEVIEIKEAGTIARCIVKDAAKAADGKPDYDGVMLLKRDNKWKVVLSNAEAEETPGVLTAEEKKELPGLWDWQTATMKRLEAQ